MRNAQEFLRARVQQTKSKRGTYDWELLLPLALPPDFPPVILYFEVDELIIRSKLFVKSAYECVIHVSDIWVYYDGEEVLQHEDWGWKKVKYRAFTSNDPQKLLLARA